MSQNIHCKYHQNECNTTRCYLRQMPKEFTNWVEDHDPFEHIIVNVFMNHTYTVKWQSPKFILTRQQVCSNTGCDFFLLLINNSWFLALNGIQQPVLGAVFPNFLLKYLQEHRTTWKFTTIKNKIPYKVIESGSNFLTLILKMNLGNKKSFLWLRNTRLLTMRKLARCNLTLKVLLRLNITFSKKTLCLSKNESLVQMLFPSGCLSEF